MVGKAVELPDGHGPQEQPVLVCVRRIGTVQGNLRGGEEKQGAVIGVKPVAVPPGCQRDLLSRFPRGFGALSQDGIYRAEPVLPFPFHGK